MMSRTVLFSLLIFAFTSLGAADQKIENVKIQVSPAVAFAPANLTIRATVEASPDNRAVIISAESSAFYRSSEVGLDGEQAPRTTQFEFGGLPPGTYEVRATLLDASGQQRGVARQEVDVVTSGRGR